METQPNGVNVSNTFLGMSKDRDKIDLSPGRPKNPGPFPDLEGNRLRWFFGERINVLDPPQLVHETLLKAREIGWTRAEAYFLPDIELQPEANYPDWKVKPGDGFWKDIRNGHLPLDSAHLGNQWIIIDGTPKPDYENDPFATLLTQLRKEGVIEVDYFDRNIPDGSRVAIARDRVLYKVFPAIAKMLDLHPEQIRRPRPIEYNFIGNFAHPEWGETTLQEWLEGDFFGGGYNHYYYYDHEKRERVKKNVNGLAHISSDDGGTFLGAQFIGFRPVIVFPSDWDRVRVRYLDHNLDKIFRDAEKDPERPKDYYPGWWAVRQTLMTDPRQIGFVLIDLPFRYRNLYPREALKKIFSEMNFHYDRNSNLKKSEAELIRRVRINSLYNIKRKLGELVFCESEDGGVKSDFIRFQIDLLMALDEAKGVKFGYY